MKVSPRRKRRPICRRGAHPPRLSFRLVVDVLAPGVADYTEVLPYAREHDLVVITKDYSDFGALSADEHEGTILVARHAHTAVEIAAAVNALVDAYPSRESFRGRQEFLDNWIP